MPRRLNVVTVTDDKVIDTVTLTGAGQLTYTTGRAREMFEQKRRLLPTDAEVFDLLSDWSNGYLMTRPA